MQKQPIAAVINFCSNESRFIGSCIEEARKFAKQIIVPVCDHFFDGIAENRALLEQVYRAYPDCLFLEYPFIPSEIPRRIFKDVSPAHFWHSCSRLIGASFLNIGIEAVLFLDADEVPDGFKFSEWLDASDYQQNTVMKLSNYWYFREPIYQALSWEDSIVLVQTRAINHDLILRQEERDAIYNLLPGPKRRHVTGPDGQPMFHHFSWVRTKDEMLKKVRSWGHKADRNWVELVEKEFSGDFQGTDFIHGYQYKTIPAPFDIRLGPAVFKPSNLDHHVVRLTQKDLRDLLKFKKSLIWKWLSSLIK
jgi:hypothetical protein